MQERGKILAKQWYLIAVRIFCLKLRCHGLDKELVPARFGRLLVLAKWLSCCLAAAGCERPVDGRFNLYAHGRCPGACRSVVPRYAFRMAQGLTSGGVLIVSVETSVRAQDLMQRLCRCANSNVRQETGSIFAVQRRQARYANEGRAEPSCSSSCPNVIAKVRLGCAGIAMTRWQQTIRIKSSYHHCTPLRAAR